jgi:NADH-quinone oxidoreductase subunit N
MSSNVLALLPELILTLTGVVVMMAEPCLKPATSRKPLGWLAIAGTVASLIAS